MYTHKTASEKLGKLDRAKIAHNTYLERRSGGGIGLRLHSTDVVTWWPDGRVTLNSGGWKTATTKDRIGYAARIHQERGQWYVTVRGKCYLFRDGMTIGPRGGVTGAPPEGSSGDKAAQRWRLKVRAYADKWTERLLSGKMPKPGPGDCWHCAMLAADGKEWGGNDHLKEHVRESYFVPSLANAIAPAISPVARGAVGYLLKMHIQDPGQRGRDVAAEQVRSAMRRYMLTRCGETPSTPR